MAPAHGGEQDFGCQAQEQAQYQAAPLQYMGFHPPIQAPNSCRAPGGALDRVDVSNRYLGNKACKYDTKIVPTPPKRGRLGKIEAAQRGDLAQ
jgi:hypothetical protein